MVWDLWHARKKWDGRQVMLHDELSTFIMIKWVNIIAAMLTTDFTRYTICQNLHSYRVSTINSHYQVTQFTTAFLFQFVVCFFFFKQAYHSLFLFVFFFLLFFFLVFFFLFCCCRFFLFFFCFSFLISSLNEIFRDKRNSKWN